MKGIGLTKVKNKIRGMIESHDHDLKVNPRSSAAAAHLTIIMELEKLSKYVQEEIRKISLTVDGVVSTEKCFIRKTGMKYLVDLHAAVNADISVKRGHEIAHDLKDTLQRELPQLGNVLIHIEPHE